MAKQFPPDSFTLGQNASASYEVEERYVVQCKYDLLWQDINDHRTADAAWLEVDRRRSCTAHPVRLVKRTTFTEIREEGIKAPPVPTSIAAHEHPAK